MQEGIEGLANSIPFVVSPLLISCAGKIVAANDAFIDLLGYDKAELYGMNEVDIAYIDDRDMLARIINDDLVQLHNLRLVTKSAQVKYCNVYPYIFRSTHNKYRMAAIIDNSDLILSQEKQIATLKNTALALARTTEMRDPYTSGHMERTAQVAFEIARLLGINGSSADMIYLGASIHDIGKIAIPIEILIKPGTLTYHERGLIQLHPDTGHNILAGVEFVDTVKQIILSHHENQDGSGYPAGIQGDAIPIEVAIVTVADCLDAIAGVRPYRKANTYENAIEIMRHESYKFEPAALHAAETLVKNGFLTGMEYGLQ